MSFAAVPQGWRPKGVAESGVADFGSTTNCHEVRGYRFSSATGRGDERARVVTGNAQRDKPTFADQRPWPAAAETSLRRRSCDQRIRSAARRRFVGRRVSDFDFYILHLHFDFSLAG